MAINLGTKYRQAAELGYKRDKLIKGTDVKSEFIGQKTVRIQSPVLVALNDYKRTGTNRFGTPLDVGDTYQELTVTLDKSFTGIVDKGDMLQTASDTRALGKLLRENMEQLVYPFTDLVKTTRFKDAFVANSGVAISAPSKTTIYNLVLAGQQKLDDADVPAEGRTILVKPATYNLLREYIVETNQEGSTATIGGKKFDLDGLNVVKVAPSRFPGGVHFIIYHKDSFVEAMQLDEARVLEEVAGISGGLFEARVIFDAWILSKKIDGVYVGMVASVATPTASYTGGSTDTIVLASSTSGTEIKYCIGAKNAAATEVPDPRFAASADLVTYADPISTANLEAGNYVIKAYATKAALTDSAVLTTTIAVSAS